MDPTLRGALALVCCSVFGCASPRGALAEEPQDAVQEVPAAPAPAPGLSFAVTPEDARIAVAGAWTGTLADLTLRGGVLPLKAGYYRVTVQRPGYQTWRAEVAVAEATETLHIELLPVAERPHD